MQKIPYTIYTNQNHEYHAENLIFYSIEQKGLFTDNGRRTPPPQKAPMGSRLASLLLSVRACGSNQGESPAAVIFSPKISEFAFRECFQVSGVEICPGVVKVDDERVSGTPFPWLLPQAFTDSKKDVSREPMGAFCGGGVLRPLSVNSPFCSIL